jgi:hypothetical protein
LADAVFADRTIVQNGYVVFGKVGGELRAITIVFNDGAIVVFDGRPILNLNDAFFNSDFNPGNFHWSSQVPVSVALCGAVSKFETGNLSFNVFYDGDRAGWFQAKNKMSLATIFALFASSNQGKALNLLI